LAINLYFDRELFVGRYRRRCRNTFDPCVAGIPGIERDRVHVRMLPIQFGQRGWQAAGGVVTVGK